MLLSAYFGLNYLFNKYIIQDTIPQLGVNTLIVGASDTQAAIDPVVYGTAANIGQLGESYCMTYWKLKNLLKKNEIDTVILGFSYAHFSDSYDLVFSPQKKVWSETMFQRIYAIEDVNSLGEFEINRRGLYSIKFKSMCLYPHKKHHIRYMGAYSNHDPAKSNIGDPFFNIDTHYFFKGKKSGVSNFAAQHLNDIIQFCKANNIKLILVSTPMHESYLKEIPEIFVDHFEQMKKELASKGVLVLDHSRTKYADNEYYDTCHLNHKGATRFTKTIKEELQRL